MSETIHIIPVDAQALRFGKVLARCGAIVKDVPYQEPTCERCIALDKRDAARLMLVLGDDEVTR